MINRRGKSRRLAVMETLEPRRVLAPLLSLEGPSEVVFEGERAAFTLRLSEPARQAESVFVTTRPGTATPGVDYASSERLQLYFAPGESSKQFFVSTLAEAVPRREGNETFFVTARPVNPGLSRALTRQVTIGDAVPRPVLSVADIRVTEGSSGASPATFTLTLGAAYPRNVTVAYATRDGSATVVDNDYSAATGVVTFLPGQTSQTVTVNVNGDRVAENDETFSLVLSAPTNATLGRTSALCTIVNDEADQVGYQVTLNFIDGPGGPVPQSVRTVAQQAVNRWARIITGDLPAVTANGFFIDDFEMTIQMGLLGNAPTDGPFNVLANARPTAFRDNGTGIPYSGITGLDPADTANPVQLLDTITHEMGHAFGFTPGADVFSRWIAGDTFVGPNAVREYNTAFRRSATSVPLQAGVRAHWDETTFGNELMSPTTTGGAEYISRITVGALQDMGYTVNYAAAENYVPPRAQPVGGGAVTTPTPATPATPTASRPPSSRPPLSLRPSLRPQLSQTANRELSTPSQQSRLAGMRLNAAALPELAGLSMTAEAVLPRKGTVTRFFATLSAS